MREFAIHAYNIISEHYGLSKYNLEYPELEIIDDEQELLTGEYRDDSNTIILNLHSILCKEQVVTVLTHEYIHYLQSPTWMTRYYNMGYDYFNHPYELEAYKREDELQHLFI